MKKIFTLIFVATLIASVNSASADVYRSLAHEQPVRQAQSKIDKAPQRVAAENEAYLAYCDEDIWPTYAGQAGTISSAAYFPPTIVSRLAGNQLKSIATNIADENATNVYLWASTSLEGEPDICNIKVQEGTWTVGVAFQVYLDTPYTLQADKGIYIGITMDCPDEYTAAVNCDWTSRSNAFLFKFPGGEWEDWSASGYGSLYILGVTTGEKQFLANDVEMLSITQNRGLKGETVQNYVNIFNYGTAGIETLEVSCEINGETNTIPVTLDWPISQYESASLSIDVKVPETEGRHDAIYTISKVNNEENNCPSGATRTGYIISLEESAKRMVFVEETENKYSEWGAVANLVLQDLNNDYADKAIGVAVHQVFPMFGTGELTCETYQPITNIVSYPYCSFVNRKYMVDAYETYYDEYDPMPAFTVGSMVDELSQSASEASITLQAQYANEEKSEVKFESNVVFNYSTDTEVPYSVAYIIVEKEVSGQYMLNRYNGDFMLDELFWGDEWEYDYFVSTTPPELLRLLDVPYENQDATYYNVARGIYDCFGIEGSLAGALTKGTAKTHTYTVTTPEAANIDSLYAVAIVIDAYSGEVINAVKCDIQEYSGVNDINSDDVIIRTQNGMPYVETSATSTVEIYNLAGHLLAKQTVEGTAQINVNATEPIVLVRVVNNNNVTVKRIAL